MIRWRSLYLTLLLAQCLAGQITQSFAPLTDGDRARDYLRDMVNPVNIFTSSASAGIGQWRDRPQEWKQGGRGFGLRFGSSYAQHITGATLMYGTASVLHEDNRYVPAPTGSSFKTRLGHAINSTFLARHDDGSSGVSVSRISSLAGASLISRTWQPASNSSWSSAGVNFGVSMAGAFGFNVAREFLPAGWHFR